MILIGIPEYIAVAPLGLVPQQTHEESDACTLLADAGAFWTQLFTGTGWIRVAAAVLHLGSTSTSLPFQSNFLAFVVFAGERNSFWYLPSTVGLASTLHLHSESCTEGGAIKTVV